MRNAYMYICSALYLCHIVYKLLDLNIVTLHNFEYVYILYLCVYIYIISFNNIICMKLLISLYLHKYITIIHIYCHLYASYHYTSMYMILLKFDF